MAGDPASAAAASHSDDDDDDEGTDTDASNSDPAAPQGHQPPVPEASAPEPVGPIPPAQPQGEAAGAGAGTEESRRLFQRLWTDDEELLILRGFLEFTSRRGTAFASHQYDTGPFYEEVQRKLSFDFSKSQLVEKLRRLKKKYRACVNRMAAQGGAFTFRSAHEGAIYDVARHIWRPAFKRDGAAGGGDASDDDYINPASAAAAAAAAAPPGATEDAGGGSAPAPTPTPRGRARRRVRRRTAQDMEAAALPATPAATLNDAANEPAIAAAENLAPVIAPPPPMLPLAPAPAPAPSPVTASDATEEALRSILSPLLKEFISSVAFAGQTGLGFGFGGVGMGGIDILGLGNGVAGLNHSASRDDKWRRQQIVELEVYLKRIELIREHVTAALEELRSSQV